MKEMVKIRKNNLTKKEIIRRFNRLIEEGRIFDERLSEIMEAYKVSKVGKNSAIYNYTCCICSRKVLEDDFFVSCRMKRTSHRWKTVRPIHKKCLEVKEEQEGTPRPKGMEGEKEKC